MLDKLNEINWHEVRACYDPGEHIPILIRRLASENDSVQREAVRDLFDNLEHQADVYPAALMSVPFLLELLEINGVHVKAEIFDILLHISSGISEDPELPVAIAKAVDDGLPVYQGLMFEPDDEIRKYATLFFISAAKERDLPLCANEVHKRLKIEGNPEIKSLLSMSLGDLISFGSFSEKEVFHFQTTLENLIAHEDDLYFSTEMLIGRMQLPNRQIDASIFERFLQQVKQLEESDHPYLYKLLSSVKYRLEAINNANGTRYFTQLLQHLQKRSNIDFITRY